MGRFFVLFLIFLSFVDAYEIDTTTVVVIDDDRPRIELAAKELSAYLEKILQDEVAIVRNREVSLDKNAVILRLKPLQELHEDGFVIKTVQNQLWILSGSERGLLFGVYYFLDHYLGCKFLSKDFEYIPQFTSKSLGKIEDVQNPRFRYREIFFHEADDLRFSYKNLLNGRLGHRLLKIDKHYPKPIPTYTYMSSELMDEKYACDGQYDYANPKARQNALKTLRQKLSVSKVYPLSYVTLEHEDRSSVCMKSLKEGESPVVPFVAYTQYLARKLQDDYPQVLFFTQAYLWSRKAPAKLPHFPDNLGVHFSVIEADFSKPLVASSNKKILEDLQSWNRYTDHAVIWHYTTNFGGYLFPYPNLFALDHDIKTFAKDDFVKGVFLQGGGVGSELVDLRVWVFAKLLWNPSLDIAKLIKTFCRYYYGDGAGAVQKYIVLLQQFIIKSGERLNLKTPIDARYLSAEHLKKLDSVLSDGLAKLKPHTPYYEHMLALFSGLDYIRIMRGEAEGNNAYIKKRFKAYLRKYPEMTDIAEGVSIKSIQKIIDLKRKHARVPRVVRGLKKGKRVLSFQEYQLELCCADIVEDKLASDGISAMMPGKSKEWGFSLPFTNIPNGKWDVYADVRIEKNKDGLFQGLKWALRYGIDPGIVKGIRFSAQFSDGYETIKIGTIQIPADKHKFVWLSPPGNEAIQKVYVDRIFFVSH